MATMKDIANICGVSTATVSKALNGYPDISEETTSLIRETAKREGYFPNSAARALKTSYTNNLGVLFIDKMQSGLGHEYFSSLLESFKVQAEKQGYDITFISRNIGNRPMSYLEHCRYRQCDGVMIASVDFEDSEVRELVNSEIPSLTIDHVFNNRTAILSDNVQGMRDLVEYVHHKGHTKIAYIHGEDTAVTQKRLAGFYSACHEFGIEVPDKYVIGARFHDPQTSRRATRALLQLSERPSCILYPDDLSYVGGMNELEQAGLRIPDDISVAGYDGIPLSQMLRPKLTTLHQDTQRLGSEAAKRLIQSIEDPKTDFPDQVVIQGQLYEGETVRVF